MIGRLLSYAYALLLYNMASYLQKLSNSTAKNYSHRQQTLIIRFPGIDKVTALNMVITNCLQGYSKTYY